MGYNISSGHAGWASWYIDQDMNFHWYGKRIFCRH